MLKFSYYIDDVKDKAWFESSNIVYGECDESDTQYKTVRIVFKNGSTYQYDDVLVSDWVTFKNSDSQGKALKEHFIKPGYKYKRIENANLEALEDEYATRSGNDFILKVDTDNMKLSLVDNKDNEKYSMDYPGEEITNDIKSMLESINLRIRIK